MFITDIALEDVTRWCTKFSTEELASQIDMCEKVLDFEKANDFIFLDEMYALREILRDECVKRVTSLAE